MYDKGEAILDSWAIPSLITAPIGGINVVKGINQFNRAKSLKEILDKRKEWGIAYRNFSGKPHEAIEKLREEQQGFVPNATKDGIDIVWGKYTPPTKPNKKGGGYGLAHIRGRRYEDGKDGDKFLDNLADLLINGKKYKKEGHTDRFYIGDGENEAAIRTNFNSNLWKWLNSAYPKD